MIHLHKPQAQCELNIPSFEDIIKNGCSLAKIKTRKHPEDK